jgi:hypothetical protein
MVAVAIVYAALLTMFIAVLSLLWPRKPVGNRSRRAALLVLAAAMLALVIGANLPSSPTTVERRQSELDRLFPAYQFHEFHSMLVAAPRSAVYASIEQVTPAEIFLFRSLVWLRRLGRHGAPSILNPPPHQPLLELASSTSFVPLADVPNEEIVLGTLVAIPSGWRPTAKATPGNYMALANSGQPGFAFAGMNFRLQDCPLQVTKTPCTLLTTETRIHSSDPATNRRFARYWRVIYPGSSIIRFMWLRAIRKRAEAESRPAGKSQLASW